MSEKLLEQLLHEMRDFKTEVTTRLDKLEQRMDGLEARMGGLEARMDGLEQRMDKQEWRMDGLETRLVNVEVAVNGLKEEHGLILRKLEERTAVTAATVARLAEDMNYLKGDVAGLIRRINDHDVDIRVIKKAVAN